MVTFLITSVLFLGLFAIAVYFWQKPANKTETIELPSHYPPSGLFSDFPPLPELTAPDDNWADELIQRAKQGDMNVLVEVNGNGNIYQKLLTAVVSSAPSQDKLLPVASFVAEHNLPANQSLVETTTRAWQTSPDRQTTSRLLHLAALTNDAELYDNTVQLALTSWRNGKLPDVSASELQALINSEFWLLSAEARSSGRGFILKRTLSDARRELEATNN